MNFKQLSLLVASSSIFSSSITTASPVTMQEDNIHISDSKIEENIHTQQEIIDIPDKKLRNIVLSLVDKNLDGIILKNEIETLTSLYADKMEISSLKGLEYAINLEKLSLNDNYIKDISAIHNFKSLKILRLNNNPINLDNEKNIEVMKKFNIEIPKNINQNFPDTILFTDEKLKEELLKQLDKSDGIITQSDMLQLTSLDLENKGISYLDGLEYATNLEDLNLSKNNIKNICPLSHLLKLKKLNISNNKIWSISALSKLINLKDLDLAGNTPTPIPDNTKSTKTLGSLDSLSKLSCLERLILSNNNITTIKALDNLTALKVLDVSQNKLNNKSFCELSNTFWEQLQSLNINRNHIYLNERIDFEFNGSTYSYMKNLLKKLSSSYLIQVNKPLLKYGEEVTQEKIEVKVTEHQDKILLPIEAISYTGYKLSISEFIIDENGNSIENKVSYDENGNIISNIDTSRNMNYILKYVATDSKGNQSNPLIINLIIKSNMEIDEKPTIQYSGNREIIVYKGNTYFQTPPILNALDKEDGIIIAEANINKIDTSKLGNHEIVYTATDSNGNQSDPVTLIIKIIELEKDIVYNTISPKNEAPILNFISNTYFEVIQHESFEMPLVTGIDDYDNVDIHLQIFYNGIKVDKIDTSKLGEYKLIYLGVDSKGKTSDELTLTIKVIKPPNKEIAPKTSTISFKDISNHWAKNIINKAVELKIAAGISNDYFIPEQPVKIADAFTFLDRVLILNNIVEDFQKNNLEGINSNTLKNFKWAIEHINSINSKLSNETFNLIKNNLENNITREMLAQILFEITNGKLPATNNNADFIDISKSLYEEAIQYCAKTGLLYGTSQNTMSPNNILTRAELVTVAVRLNDILKTK
ncbi:MAG: hypothetical protein ATN32_02215 [Candidatus Epulonipiscium fishelsonii]|nr:MAG: hypothetical protein ATN32_02215 [Epulopiscium sp. AS2M-Bin002]